MPMMSSARARGSMKETPPTGVPQVPRLDANLIQVIAQTVPAVGPRPLSDSVASAVARDAEAYVCAIAQTSLSFMQHSRRDTMTASDVASALRLRKIPMLPGYESRSSDRRQGFDAVPRLPGLYVLHDEFVELASMIGEGKGRHVTINPSCDPAWLVFNGVVQRHRRKSQSPVPRIEPARSAPKTGKRPRILSREFDAVYTDVAALLQEVTEENSMEEAVNRMLLSVGSMKTVAPVVTAFLSMYTSIVASNACASGVTARMIAATRCMRALLSNARYGVDAHVHSMFPAILTCLLGPNLGTGDHFALRCHAALALGDAFSIVDTPLVRIRIAKTILAAMTASDANMGVIYGSIRGLASLDPDMIRTVVLPQLPALLSALREIADSLKRFGEASAKAPEVIEKYSSPEPRTRALYHTTAYELQRVIDVVAEIEHICFPEARIHDSLLHVGL